MGGAPMLDRDVFEGLKQRLYLLSFVDEFGPVYAVYTLWFNDNGISTAQVSTVFVVWAAAALVLEIPSGALADRVDRRFLVAGAFSTRMVGIVVWLLWPSFTGALFGTVMFAAHDAAASGSWEAMIHDQLSAVGRADAYQPVMARIAQFSHLGVAAGTLLGAALLHVRFGADFGIETLGWLTVAAHLGSISLVATLPYVRSTASVPDAPSPHQHAIGAGPVAGAVIDDIHGATPSGVPGASSIGAWWATMLQGLRDARRSATILRIIAIGAMVEGLFILDEYIPLLVRARGGTDAVAPIIVFAVWIGLLGGGEIAARRASITSAALGVMLIAGVGIMFIAFVTAQVWTLALIAFGYGVLEAARITADARLQERTPDATRATVTSLRGFGGASVSMLAFVVIGVMSDGDDPTPGHFVVLAALLVTAGLVMWWLPERGEMEA